MRKENITERRKVQETLIQHANELVYFLCNYISWNLWVYV